MFVGSRAAAPPLGSYLAALVIYAPIFDRTPVGLPSTLTLEGGAPLSVDPSTATLLQEAAASVTLSPQN